MEQNIFLDELYLKLKALGLIRTQTDFSVLCGRRGTWLSVIKASRNPFTTDAAITLSVNLKRLATSLSECSMEGALELSDQLITYAQNHVAAKIQPRADTDVYT
jgi:hypothetical protein